MKNHMSEVIEAYEKGAIIEQCSKSDDFSNWVFVKYPKWNFQLYYYRIAKSRWREWKHPNEVPYGSLLFLNDRDVETQNDIYHSLKITGAEYVGEELYIILDGRKSISAKSVLELFVYYKDREEFRCGVKIKPEN